MAGSDAELELIRHGVNCAALLEAQPRPWRLDRKESTRRALKYRRGAGEIIIVNHDGRGWWDPQSTAKGDVFDLVRHLNPGFSFGEARQALRRFVGVAPTYPETLRRRRRTEPDRSPAERWAERGRLRRGSPVWAYLTGARGLPADVLEAAGLVDVLREGPYGSAWFAHRDAAGVVSHVEIRGPRFKGSLAGGHKTLFRLGRAEQPKFPGPRAAGITAEGGEGLRRFAVTEAPIDALSLAALEGMRPDTLYAATGGGMGPGTIAAIEQVLRGLAGAPDALLASAVDANAAGERYAAQHAALADAARVRFLRLKPPYGDDWNDTLRRGRGA
jgi:hypothetical protein